MRRWTLAVLAAGAVTLGGAGAFAATAAGAGAPSAFLTDVASHLGVQPSALQGAIQQADIDHLNQLQASGKLTAAQAQARVARIQSGQAVWLGNRGPAVRLFPRRVVLSTTSGYLGLIPRQIAADWRAGQSLDQIATSVSGKSAAGLQAALTAAAQSRLAALVSSHKMTAAREQALLQALPARLSQLMAHTRAAKPAAPAPSSSAGA